MQVEIRELTARKVVCVSHKGAYFMICKAFSELGEWMKETKIEAGLMVGIYYDNPDETPAEELRSDAGVFVSDDFQTDDPRVHVVELPGGLYGVGTHVGSYEGLPNAWDEMVGKWLPSSGYTFGDAPPFEVYLDDCSVVPVEEVRTEICVALQK